MSGANVGIGCNPLICQCSDGVRVEIDLADFESELLRSVSDAAPGDVVPLPAGVSSACLKFLRCGHHADAMDASMNLDAVDVVRAAIELDCSASVHTDRIVRSVAANALSMKQELDAQELVRWLDTFSAAPPLFFLYVPVVCMRFRRGLLHCGAPSDAVVDAAIDFFRRTGRRSDRGEASEMAGLAGALAQSVAVRGREVDLARCFVEHVGFVGPGVPLVINRTIFSTYWEALCKVCLDTAGRLADATAIADACNAVPAMGFRDLVISCLLENETRENAEVLAFIEHLFRTTTSDETREAIWNAALGSTSRDVVQWAAACTGRRITPPMLRVRRNDINVEMLIDIAIRDDRCLPSDVRHMLLEFKAHLTVDMLSLEKVGRLLQEDGALTSDLLALLATKTKPRPNVIAAIAHLATCPGLRRGSDGWFDAIAHFAKRRDRASILSLMRLPITSFQ
jgi:hypothetical protein